MPDERLVKTITRRMSNGKISMWGTLHANPFGGFAGWLCDSWTEAGASGAEVLLPRLHWLSKDDNRFHLVKLDIPAVGTSSVYVGQVDSEIEPRREAFMRSILAQWESEYLDSESVHFKQEGSLDIHWENSNEPTATPHYRLLFLRYTATPSGGALQPKRIVGDQALQAYLVEIHFTPEDAGQWIEQLKEQTSVSIPNVRLASQFLADYGQ
jgi:hypothetical protein